MPKSKNVPQITPQEVVNKTQIFSHKELDADSFTGMVGQFTNLVRNLSLVKLK